MENLKEQFEGLMEIVRGGTGPIVDSVQTVADSFASLGKMNLNGLRASVEEIKDEAVAGFGAGGKAADSFRTVLDGVLPVVVGVAAGMQAWSGFKAAIGVIKGLAVSFQTASLQVGLYTLASAQATAAELANVGALTLKEIAVGLLNGQITLATAAQLVWNKAMNANPVAIVATAVGVLVGGIAALVSNQDDATDSAQLLAEANDRLGQTWEGIAENLKAFYDGIGNARSIMEDFNSELFISEEAQTALTTKMQEVQAEISEIARTASEERRNLTDSEIERLDELFAKMDELSKQELDVAQKHQDAVKQRAEDMAALHEMTAENAQMLIKSAEETREEVIAKADEQYTNELLLLRQTYEAKGMLDSEEYERARVVAQQEYDSAVTAANNKCGATMSIIQQAYLDENTALEEKLNRQLELKAMETEEEKEYLKQKQEIEDAFKEAVKVNSSDSLALFRQKQSDLETLESEHNGRLAGIRDEMTDNMDASTQDLFANWLGALMKTEQYNGYINTETEDLVNGVLSTMDTMPDKTKKSMQDALKPMMEEMEKQKPSLIGKMGGIANGILAKIRSVFDEHSPSRETRKIFQFLMKGMQLGMEDKTPDVMKQSETVAAKVLDKFSILNGKDPGIRSLVERMAAAVQHSQNQTAARISAAANYQAGGQLAGVTNNVGGDTYILNQPVATPGELFRAARIRRKEAAYE